MPDDNSSGIFVVMRNQLWCLILPVIFLALYEMTVKK